MQVPIAISALTSEALETRGLKSIQEISEFTPGLFSQVQGNGRVDRVSRRLTFRGLSVNVGYNHNWDGSFTVTDNIALTPADFDEYCITVPTDSRLSNSGQQLCGFNDLNRIIAPNNLIFNSSSVGGGIQDVFDGFDFDVNARLGRNVLLSGGVDSSVAAALIHRAIGDKLTCVFVDHGLLRLNEGDMVMDMFAGKLHARVIRVDASDLFLGKLAGVSDPEQKRKIIGGLFVDVFKAEAAKLKAGGGGHQGATFLAQGTIYPDVIESGGAKSKKAVTIKSHHNVGGLPEQLGLKLLEPLRDLFKDEVRELGVALGLPREMVYRHPFPGPGLGVRILGEVKKEYADLLRRADAIFIEELHANVDPHSGKSWYDLTSQAFTVFLPVKSVGVMGDGRTYDYVVALRAVQTSDFMTADWAELPYALLKRVSSRIINEVRGINRVTYDVSSKPPATIEWE